MIYLNVRCCCTPNTVYGAMRFEENYLLREKLENRKGFWHSFRPKLEKVGDYDFTKEVGETSPIEQNISFEVKNLFIKGQDMVSHNIVHFGAQYEELAIYSDDRPIEFWEKFPEFIKGANVPYIIGTR